LLNGFSVISVGIHIRISRQVAIFCRYFHNIKKPGK
jgi:hypothetical protein